MKEWHADAPLWFELQFEHGATSHQCCLMNIRSLTGKARKIEQRVPGAKTGDGGMADLNDGQGAVQCTGIEILLHVLRRKFDVLDVVRQDEAQQKVDMVKRKPGQSLDSLRSPRGTKHRGWQHCDGY